jgi:hypothetical protein
VTLGLHRHAQSVVASEVHRCHHLICGGGPRDHRRALLDGQIPGRAGGIPLLLAGLHDLESVHPVSDIGRSAPCLWPTSRISNAEIRHFIRPAFFFVAASQTDARVRAARRAARRRSSCYGAGSGLV